MTATIHARFRCAFPGFDLDVDLTLPGTGITALFGHSGCGKTTLLRCMAGLQNAPGTMTVLGEPWQTEEFVRPVHKRALAYVFQETQLFPNLNVRRNLEFGYRRIPAGERQIRFDDAVRWLGLESLLERMPAGLSGGERQRVAIARALLTSPRCPWLPLPRVDCTDLPFALHYFSSFARLVQVGSPLIFAPQRGVLVVVLPVVDLGVRHYLQPSKLCH